MLESMGSAELLKVVLVTAVASIGITLMIARWCWSRLSISRRIRICQKVFDAVHRDFFERALPLDAQDREIVSNTERVLARLKRLDEIHREFDGKRKAHGPEGQTNGNGNDHNGGPSTTTGDVDHPGSRRLTSVRAS
jgi:hypothetical protein